MTQILLIGDSFLGAVPFRAADLEGDSWFALERVGALARELRPDVLIHAGGICGAADRKAVDRFRAWAEDLGWVAGTQVVLAHDANDAVDVSAALADFDLLLPDDEPVEIRGVLYAHVLSEYQRLEGGVLVGSGIVAGTYGRRAATLEESRWRRPHSGLVALAGVPRAQMLSRNALTVGQLTPADIGDLSGSTATMVELGADGVRAVCRYRLPSRPRRVIRLFELDYPSVDEFVRGAIGVGRAAVQADRAKVPPELPGGPLVRVELHAATAQAAARVEPMVGDVTDELLALGATVVDIRICRTA